MPNEKTFKLTSSKSGSGLIPSKKHQYQRTSSGTAIRGVSSQTLTAEGEPPFYNYDSSGMRGTPLTPMTPSGSAIPPALRVRLYELFVQIEKEFETLYVENVGLQERVDWYNSEQQQHQQHLQQQQQQRSPFQQHLQQQQQHQQQQHQQQGQHLRRPGSEHVEPTLTPTPSSASMASLMNTMAANLPKGMSKGMYAHKIRTHTNKLRQQTNRIMSNLKGPPAINCTAPQIRFTGHKDGVWEVSVSRMGLPVIGTASADHTAIIWGMHSGKPLLQYQGHSGSVNSIRFHPNKELVLTASGDATAHIWQCAVHLYSENNTPGRMASSEEELGDTSEVVDMTESYIMDDSKEDYSVLRTPLRSLAGHGSVVIAADWLPGGDHAVTAGWDRLACIWDTNTGQLLHQLSGHDDELTHTAAHPYARLVVTSSKDSTFRLWDFRESIHSVSVFQGHQDTVTSAVFTREDQVVSGSDDRSVRIWDLRNMRSPLASIHIDSAVNRLAIANSGVIAIPLDNRNVRLYDLNGQRLGRLPRSSRQGHNRMVCSTAWSDETRPNLFTCGFDKVVLGWNIEPRENVKETSDASGNPGGISFTCSNATGPAASADTTSSSKLNLGLKSNY